MALLLVWHVEGRTIDPETLLALDRFELRPGLVLVDIPLGLSPLYHRIKWALPAGTPLLAAPLAEAPKFRLMEPGALTWVKARRSVSGGSMGVD